MNVEYKHNNSGGSWWLSREDWLALEQRGWEVRWLSPNDWFYPRTAAMYAILRDVDSIDEAKQRWSVALPEHDVDDEGCECCGPPHDFFELIPD